MRYDNDRDQADYDHGPYAPANAECSQCHRAYAKGRDEIGDLCDGCAYAAWVDEQERRSQAHRVTPRQGAA